MHHILGFLTIVGSVLGALAAAGIITTIVTSVELSSKEGEEWLEQLWLEITIFFEKDFMEFFGGIGEEIENLSDEAVNGKERRLEKWR